MRPPPLGANAALFLDFDGVLVEIDAERDKPRLGARDGDMLLELAGRLGGALALVSGRALADLDTRAPVGVFRVGSHGAEIAPPGARGAASGYRGDMRLLEEAQAAAATLRGVELEIKPTGVALHYRAAPEHAPACADALSRAIARAEGDYALQPGKMVVEARLRFSTKGAALAALATEAPFAGRRPIAVGDDETDESMFAAAQGLGGAGVKVGDGASIADWRLASTVDVWSFLRATLAELSASPRPATGRNHRADQRLPPARGRP